MLPPDHSRSSQPVGHAAAGLIHGLNRPRIVIADDHGILLEGLKKILEPEFEVVAMVRDGHALIRAVETLRPDVAVAGVSMPLLTGIEALRKLKSAGTTTKFVFLTASYDVGPATQALRLGASCYVLKQSAAEELVAAIHAALEGLTYIAPPIAPAVFQRLIDHPDTDGDRRLTVRERQVLQLLAEGNTLKEVAAVLKVSPRTVEFHRNNVANKTGFHSLAELSRHAVGLGLVPQKP